MTDTQTSWLLGRSQAILDQLPYRSDLTIADMGALGLVELFDKATYLYKGSLLTPDVDGHTMAMFFQSWARVATALQAADTVVAPERNPDARLDVSVPSRDYNDHRVQPGWKLPKREQTPGYRYREPHIARVSLWDVGDGSILVSRDFTSLSNYRDRLAGTAKTTKLPRAAHISGAVKLPAESSEIAHAEAEWTWTGALKHWFAVRARSKRPAHTARIADRAVRAETVLPASQTRELGEATVATAMPTAESLDRLTSYAEERATLDEATGAYASAVREMSSWLADRRPIDVPSADDIARVRTWIEEMPPRPATCEFAKKIDNDDVAKAIDAAVTAAGEAAALELRFITLAHLANACATPAEMDAYRQGVSKLLNSLSWGAQPISPIAIDDTKTILSFKLSDIGWVDEHWNALARAEPKAFATDLSGKSKTLNANSRPIRGDWLANTATQPPFYNELLGLPPTLEETARLLGVNRQMDGATGHGMRAGVRSSLVTRGPRVIERHQADTRRFWLAFDFVDGQGEHDIFDRPLGGVRGAPDKAQFRSDGQRLIFTLSNGFFGYALFEPDGHRIDQLPQRLEPEAARSSGSTVAGASCLSCHGVGLKPFTDAVKGYVASDKFTGSREVRDQALALYDSANDWAHVLDEDGYRFRRALIQAGIDPDLSLHGLELTAALANRYERSVDFATLAAELGLNSEAFEQRLSLTRLPDPSLAQRLRQGVLSRADANRLLTAINPKSVNSQPELALPTVSAPTIALALWTNQTIYKVGDLMTVYARPSVACYLTLISINASGKATVLFPSEFDQENLVPADSTFALPNDQAHYQFRLKDPGTESIVGRCQTAAKLPAGVEPDYERQRFTILGNYENFIKTSYGLDAEAARKKSDDRIKTARSPASKDAKPEAIARAAVSLTIKP